MLIVACILLDVLLLDAPAVIIGLRLNWVEDAILVCGIARDGSQVHHQNVMLVTLAVGLGQQD